MSAPSGAVLKPSAAPPPPPKPAITCMSVRLRRSRRIDGKAPEGKSRNFQCTPPPCRLTSKVSPNFEIDSRNLVAAAKVLGVQVQILRAGTPAEISSPVEAIAQRRLGPVVVIATPSS